jgi:hypothetical protein
MWAVSSWHATCLRDYRRLPMIPLLAPLLLLPSFLLVATGVALGITVLALLGVI